MLKMGVLAVALLAVAGMTNAAMVITNGDFQTADLTGWITEAGAVVQANVGPAGAGDYAVYISNDWSNSLRISGNYSTDWPNGFTPGTQYTLSFDLKNIASSAHNMSLYVTNSSMGGIASMNIGATAVGAGWTTQTLNFIAPSDGIINVSVMGEGGGNKSLFLDNIKITPEPATMSLLGLGLLAIRRRRSA